MSTAIFIIHQEFISFPIGTFLQFLTSITRFSSVVLPIVAIFTLRPVMFELIERTKHCFEVEHVEVLIFLESVDQRHTEFRHRMSKRTVDSVFTFTDLPRVLLTELGFVFGSTVDLFYEIVGVLTFVFQWTLFILLYERT